MKSALKKRIIVLCCTILSSTLALAQNTISGKVSDNSGKGISGASVTAVVVVVQKPMSMVMYSLSLPNGSATITASFVGYASLSKTVNVSGNTTVDFELLESSTELGEVILTTGSRSLPRSSINTPLPIDALQAS